MSVNIGGDQKDKSYRYKMPILISKIEGRGNGIKTVIPNMPDIAKSLHTDPAYPTKFFGMELGALSNYTKKDERAVVNGAHNASDLAKLLTQFIEIFILCPKCALPEIRWKVTSKRVLVDCAACGHNGELSTSHKLVTFIIKNPPGGVENADGKKDKKGKKEKKEKKDKKKKGENDEENDDDDEEETKDTGDASASAQPAEAPAPVKNEEEVRWFSDTSKEAQDQRKLEELSEMKKETHRTIEKIASGTMQNLTKETPVSVLRLYLSDKKRTPDEVVSECKRLQLSRGLDETQKIQVLVQAIIDPTEPKTVPSQFVKQTGLLKKLAVDSASCKSLICAIEDLLGNVEKKLTPYMAHVLKAMYENDVLDEETLIRWFDSPAESDWLVSKQVAAQMRTKAKPFIEWLKSADEDEDDEEDD